MPFHLVCAIIRDINNENLEQSQHIDEEQGVGTKRYELPAEIKNRRGVER